MTSGSDHSKGDRWLGPGELARQANTSIKALRVYERAGLLVPDRRVGGWRIYGPAHVARLHQVLALKALGLSLRQIADALGRDGLAIGRILDLQATHLARDIRSSRRRLRQIQEARHHLARHGGVPPDVLLTLARDLNPERPLDLAELRALIEDAARDEGVEDQVRDALRTHDAQDGGVLETQIGDLLADAEILAVEGDPGRPNAAALADRWVALASSLGLPSGDDEGAAALRDLSARLRAEPRLSETLLFLRRAVRLRTGS